MFRKVERELPAGLRPFGLSLNGKPRAVLDDDSVRQLDANGWRKGTKCYATNSQTERLGLEMYACAITIGGWDSGRGVNAKTRYALVRVTGRKQVRSPHEGPTWYKTQFVLLNDGCIAD